MGLMGGIYRRPTAAHWLYVPVLLTASCLSPGFLTLQAEESPALASLEGALNDLPLDPSARQEIGAALKSHDYASAEGTLVQVADQHPKVPQIYGYLGRLFFVDGKYLNAAIALKKAEALQPLEERDRFTLAMAYISLERPAWARPELEKLAEVSPRNPLYPYWQGRLEYDAQNVPAAVARFEKVIALDPEFMKAYDNLGLCFEAMGKNDEAIQQYRNAVRLNREHNIRSAWPPMNLGTLLTKLDRLDEAEPLFRESLQFDANFAQSHYQLGVLLQKQNKIPAAVEELKRAAALDSVYSEPHYALARLYRRTGDLEQAQRELQIFQDLKAKEPTPRLE
jgi:tetratricopeptide (TPR) repeat protein